LATPCARRSARSTALAMLGPIERTPAAIERAGSTCRAKKRGPPVASPAPAQHRPHEPPDACAQLDLAAGEGVAELAGHSLCPERLGASDAVGVDREGGAEPGGEQRDPSEGVGVLQSALELGVDDRVGAARFVAAGVADGLLALRVGPAGAVGDQLAMGQTSSRPASSRPHGARRPLGSIRPPRMFYPGPRFLRVASACRAPTFARTALRRGRLRRGARRRRCELRAAECQ
jgi:hypothetical protein